MSDEAKRLASSFWVAPALVVALLVAYEVAHYATAVYALRGRAWVFEKHTIGDENAPPWVEKLFWPAARIDALLGVRP